VARLGIVVAWLDEVADVEVRLDEVANVLLLYLWWGWTSQVTAPPSLSVLRRSGSGGRSGCMRGRRSGSGRRSGCMRGRRSGSRAAAAEWMRSGCGGVKRNEARRDAGGD